MKQKYEQIETVDFCLLIRANCENWPEIDRKSVKTALKDVRLLVVTYSKNGRFK